MSRRCFSEALSLASADFRSAYFRVDRHSQLASFLRTHSIGEIAVPWQIR